MCRVGGVGRGHKPEGGIEVVACDCDGGLVLDGGSGSVFAVKHNRALAEIRDVVAGHALGGAGEIGGQERPYPCALTRARWQ